MQVFKGYFERKLGARPEPQEFLCVITIGPKSPQISLQLSLQQCLHFPFFPHQFTSMFMLEGHSPVSTPSGPWSQPCFNTQWPLSAFLQIQ